MFDRENENYIPRNHSKILKKKVYQVFLVAVNAFFLFQNSKLTKLKCNQKL